MRNQLRIKLGRLASLEFQLRFCVHGSKSEYVLPNELVESAVHLVETIVGTTKLAAAYTDKEQNALRAFLHAVEQHASDTPFDDPSVNNEELITKDPGWIAARRSAEECMQELGLNAAPEELL